MSYKFGIKVTKETKDDILKILESLNYTFRFGQDSAFYCSDLDIDCIFIDEHKRMYASAAGDSIAKNNNIPLLDHLVNFVETLQYHNRPQIVIDGHEVKFHEDYIEVGCTTIPANQIEEIYERWKHDSAK